MTIYYLGKKNNDIRLQQDDVVFVPIKQKTVQTIGSIKRQKFFELKNDETLLDLIQIAGGPQKRFLRKKSSNKKNNSY